MLLLWLWCYVDGFGVMLVLLVLSRVAGMQTYNPTNLGCCYAAAAFAAIVSFWYAVAMALVLC